MKKYMERKAQETQEVTQDKADEARSWMAQKASAVQGALDPEQK